MPTEPTPPPKKNKYGDPFKKSPEQLRHIRRQRYEAIAQIIQPFTKDKRPLNERATDISLAEYKRKAKK